MNKRTLIYLIIAVAFTYDRHIYAVLQTDVSFPGYTKWTPLNSVRGDMYCPDTCFNDPEEDERCCCCDAVPCWELDPDACNVTVGQLYVEYTDAYGTTILVPTVNTTLYEVTHTYGRLRKFPTNMCDFADSLVKIDFSFNRIENITEITCLNKLDTLRLDSNRIKEINNDTFSNMEYLRIASLANNYIVRLDPNTNQMKTGNILMADFSYNIVESLDITNIVRPGPFCNVSCEGCEVQEQTNLLNYEMEWNNIHGPGKINLRNTSGESFINFTSIGVNDISEIGHYFAGRMEYDASSILCDCSLYPFFTGLGPEATKYWPGLFDEEFFCLDPERMAGKSVNEIYQTKQYEELVCELPNCPRNCKCTDEPSKNQVTVKCTNQTRMPEFMPIGHWNNAKISLDLSDPSNNVESFDDRNYIDRIVSLDLSGNKLRSVDANAIGKMDDTVVIDMQDRVINLPRTFYHLNPNRIEFGDNPVKCNCTNTWLGDWVRHHNAVGKLYCQTDSHGVILAELVTDKSLDCNFDDNFPMSLIYILAVLLIVLFLVVAALYYFRYEIMLLKRKYLDKKNNTDALDFDAMLTFSTENADVFRWVEHQVLPALVSEGYSLFIPFFHESLGANREHEIASGVSRSRNYVIFLCKKYLHDENSVQEFEMVWKYFCMDKSRNIIVVNFDNLNSSDIFVHRLRAFVRIHDDLNFIERETKIFERLKRRLGPVRKTIIYPNVFGKRNGIEKQFGHDDKNGLENINEALGTVQYRHGNVYNREQPWYERLHARHTICNCKYRECYLHSSQAYNANAANDILRKRVMGADGLGSHNGKKQSISSTAVSKRTTVNSPLGSSSRPSSSNSKESFSEGDYDNITRVSIDLQIR